MGPDDPELLPPRDRPQAEALGHAGDRLIPHLVEVSRTCTEHDIPLVIDAAALTGGPEALKLLAELAHRKLVRRHKVGHPVTDAFMRGWNYFDPECYADSVIATLDLRDVQVTDPRCLRGISSKPPCGMHG